MAENSKIEWTHHTFNPWWGCMEVSEACDNCYARELAKRFGRDVWGPHAERMRTGEKNWNEPRKWNREAEKLGIRYRVFCASMADVFDNQVDELWRVDLWKLIAETPHLDWLLLTKRPQNIHKMLPADWGDGYANVWLGTTVEHQKAANRGILPLLNVPAVVRFLSCEPLLGPVDLTRLEIDMRHIGGPRFINGLSQEGGQARIDWVIAGGESGSHFRDVDPDWIRSLRDQCEEAGVAFLFKQWSGASQPIIKKLGRELDGREWNGYPTPRKAGAK